MTLRLISLCALIGLFLSMSACSTGDTDQSSKEPAQPQQQSGAPLEKASDTGGQCGGIVGFYCKNNSDYCAMPLGSCRIADGMGTCTESRPFCTKEYRPVCGCDGKTYGNACTAAAAGMNIDYEGVCKAAS